MKEKPDRYNELEARVWDNLIFNNLLGDILSRSAHASDPTDYIGAEFYNEFQLNTINNQYMMWIKINITHKDGFQPVTPKIYRISEDEVVQKELCDKIWDEVTEDNIKYIAQVAANEYHRGDRWMDVSQKRTMDKFYPAIQEGDVIVELIPNLAQYKVFNK